jgi:hypothetical protein
MEELKSYIIQMYSEEDGMWIDCEDGRFNCTPSKLEIALDRVQLWAESIDGDFRLVERIEQVILDLSDDSEEDNYYYGLE